MNKQQSKLISAKLNHTPDTARAVELVLVDGLTAYAAEKRIYGKPTGHIKRASDNAALHLTHCEEVITQAISSKKVSNTDQLAKACE